MLLPFPHSQYEYDIRMWRSLQRENYRLGYGVFYPGNVCNIRESRFDFCDGGLLLQLFLLVTFSLFLTNFVVSCPVVVTACLESLSQIRLTHKMWQQFMRCNVNVLHLCVSKIIV